MVVIQMLQVKRQILILKSLVIVVEQFWFYVLFCVFNIGADVKCFILVCFLLKSLVVHYLSITLDKIALQIQSKFRSWLKFHSLAELEKSYTSSRPEVFLKKVFQKYAANLQENIHTECDFNNVALELYWNRTLAWVFSCKFAAYFQNIFSWEHLKMAASQAIFWVLFLSIKILDCIQHLLNLRS